MHVFVLLLIVHLWCGTADKHQERMGSRNIFPCFLGFEFAWRVHRLRWKGLFACREIERRLGKGNSLEQGIEWDMQQAKKDGTQQPGNYRSLSSLYDHRNERRRTRTSTEDSDSRWRGFFPYQSALTHQAIQQQSSQTTLKGATRLWQKHSPMTRIPIIPIQGLVQFSSFTIFKGMLGGPWHPS
jgi:hypothetical protein